MRYLFLVSLLLFSSSATSENWLSDLLNPPLKAEELDDPVNTGVQGKTFNARQLSVELDNINDVGFIIVIDQSGKATIVASAEQTMGITGSVEVDLDPYLKYPTNLLIFALWNREGTNLDLKYWEKDFLNGYSYQYSLIADGTTLYKLEGDKAGNAGIRYWNAFSIYKKDDGLLTIAPINKDVQTQIKLVFEGVSHNTALTSIDQKTVNLGANIASALMRKW